jgi:hypothetical protein
VAANGLLHLLALAEDVYNTYAVSTLAAIDIFVKKHAKRGKAQYV